MKIYTKKKKQQPNKYIYMRMYVSKADSIKSQDSEEFLRQIKQNRFRFQAKKKRKEKEKKYSGKCG